MVSVTQSMMFVTHTAFTIKCPIKEHEKHAFSKKASTLNPFVAFPENFTQLCNLIKFNLDSREILSDKSTSTVSQS